MNAHDTATPLNTFSREPGLRVGLAEGLKNARVVITGRFLLADRTIEPGTYTLKAEKGCISLLDARNRPCARGRDLHLVPAKHGFCTFTLPDNSIGRDFHWQRSSSQTFRGTLAACCFEDNALTLINHISLEDYLEAVVCSEMSPDAPKEFLKAHCVISRSWVLAQLQTRTGEPDTGSWTDSAAHTHYDVCNDDHCQRYHGIGPVNAAARSALAATRGEVLWSEGRICDTRFSKCCGGITEQFSTCWQDTDFPYLQPLADCDPAQAAYLPPLHDEKTARGFIQARPRVFCNVTDRKLLESILPAFDYETGDFFRWKVCYTQDELQTLIENKTGINVGNILHLEARKRGPSGRISELRIVGSKQSQTVAKELAIRRALSSSHLYSSAFYVEALGEAPVPHTFVLHGAGWGHGVGLCQIGAAAMAHSGHGYHHILAHYFKGAGLKRLY